MRRCFIGPMPVEDFFQEFLPTQEGLSEEGRAGLLGFEAIAKTKKEKEKYGKFVHFFHCPVSLGSLIVIPLLGLHYKLILSQDQSGQLVDGFRDRI